MPVFYAIEHRYGAGTVNADTGRPVGRYFVFDTRAARDAWVADGPDYRHRPGARETLKSSDRHLRQHVARGNLLHNAAGEYTLPR